MPLKSKIVRRTSFHWTRFTSNMRVGGGGSSLAPLGTFEGKVPSDAMKLVEEREAAIKAGDYTVEIDDSEPKSN